MIEHREVMKIRLYEKPKMLKTIVETLYVCEIVYLPSITHKVLVKGATYIDGELSTKWVQYR